MLIFFIKRKKSIKRKHLIVKSKLNTEFQEVEPVAKGWWLEK